MYIYIYNVNIHMYVIYIYICIANSMESNVYPNNIFCSMKQESLVFLSSAEVAKWLWAPKIRGLINRFSPCF